MLFVIPTRQQPEKKREKVGEKSEHSETNLEYQYGVIVSVSMNYDTKILHPPRWGGRGKEKTIQASPANHGGEK